MRAVEIVRNEMIRLGNPRIPVAQLRQLTNIAKAAARHGKNPRAEVSRTINRLHDSRLQAR